MDGDVKTQAAQLILQPYVEAIAARFLAFGFAKIARVKVRVTPDAREGARHYAACRVDGQLLLLAPEMATELPEDTLLGILAHEFGHAVDFLYPAQIVIPPRGPIRFLERGRTRNDGVPRALAAAWEDRDDDTIERTADRIGESVMGLRIGYAGPCRLQTLGAGVSPRPKGLT